MDSFDNKVTKMERDILEIRNNIDCVKSKNHKTIYSIVESINTLSKNNSKKKVSIIKKKKNIIIQLKILQILKIVIKKI